MKVVVGLWMAGVMAWCQVPSVLTLEEAERTALMNHPRLESADLRARAADAAVDQVKAANRPVVSGAMTAVGADQGTILAAGALQAQGLGTRIATGLSLSQLVTDFGRTTTLTDSAKLRAAAQRNGVDVQRAELRLRIEQAYFAALGAKSVLRVAQATLEARRLTLRQVRGLSESNLRSTLDVSFADVAVSEAELAVYQAENNLRSTHAALSTAIGFADDPPYDLVDLELPPAPQGEPEPLVQEALDSRPDLAVAKLNTEAARKFAEAEARARYPTLSLIGAAGVVPIRQQSLTNTYAAGGLNVTLPFLNGGLLRARQAEAELRALAADQDAQSLALEIAGNVRVAWSEANTAYRRLAVTQRLVEQADLSLRLANTRYETGLGGIVEVTQAQLAQTAAQINVASARYEYLIRIANLNHAMGNLK